MPALASGRPQAVSMPVQRISYGPWVGSMRSRPASQVSRAYLAGSLDDGFRAIGREYHYRPRQGYWQRRKGQTQKFDTFGSAAGMLPAKWGAKSRQIDEFISPAVSDGVPTLMALLSKETIVTGLDDGRFSNIWIRDQVNSVNYSIGDEFTAGYPAPGSIQALKFAPLWYDSGDGGISRGVEEFQRRLLFNGSRSFIKAGTNWYFPSVLGTPSRWGGTFTPASQALMYSRPNGVSSTNGNWGAVGGTQLTAINESQADTPADPGNGFYDRYDSNIGNGSILIVFDNVTTLLSSLTTTGCTIHLTMRCSAAYASRMYVTIDDSTGVKSVYSNIAYSGSGNSDSSDPSSPTYGYQGQITGTFVRYSLPITAARFAAVSPAWNQSTQLRVSIVNSGIPASSTWDLAQAEIQVGSQTIQANRLIPSGPLPPTHSGSIAKGSAVAGSNSVTLLPSALLGASGGWTLADGTSTINLWDPINDTPFGGNPDYIRAYGSTTSTALFQMSQGDGTAGFQFIPGADDTIKIRWKAFRLAPNPSADLFVSLYSGATLIAASQQTLGLYPSAFEFNLSGTQIGTLTGLGASAWTDLRVQLLSSGGSATEIVAVISVDIEYTPSAVSAAGGWKGHDRFYYSAAYKFEDDSVWMPCTPRAPNVQVRNGYNLFTVDAANPLVGYNKVTWSNLPVPPFGIKKLLLLRSPKIDSTTSDNLQIVPLDLRIVGEVDAGVTSFDDYGADDDAPYLDVDKLIVRTDHIMPSRARWNFAGVSRAGHAYGGLSPAAITLAPIGITADYDLNSSDTTAALWSNPSSYYTISSAGLTLVRDTGSATSVKVFAFSIYTTLEKLVDGINKTSCTDTDWSGGAGKASQWRAQVLPGQNPQASLYPTCCLCPTIRTVASVTISGTGLTAASGLSVVPVGAYVTGTGITDGTYITKIVSDTSLTMSAAGTSGTVTLNFVAGTGDTLTGAVHGAYEGYTRVIANSHPGFLYFTKTYLNQFPIEKSSIWLTVANPESSKCAPNCFSGGGATKHVPPDTGAGIAMGGVAIDNGFFTPFSKKRAVIVNTRDTGSGLDKDFHLLITNEASGVIGPLTAGNRCAFAMTPEGWIGADLEGEIPLSADTYLHPVSDAVVGVGDFAYEAPLLIAASGSDTDTGQMFARVMRGALWVNYRASGASPNRQVCYDFSSGRTNAGRAALIRDEPLVSEGRIVAPAGTLYGWSLPLVRSCSQMAEGRRSDGSHLYAWNDDNAGSTGDGRIDEIETSDTDNGTAISANLAVPWESADSSDDIAVREIVFEHSSPAGAIVSGMFNRSLSGDLFTCTPVATSSLVQSIYRWILGLAARVQSAACWVGWTQTAGGAGELRAIELQATNVRDFKPGRSA